jgi:hypothetical protein
MKKYERQKHRKSTEYVQLVATFLQISRVEICICKCTWTKNQVKADFLHFISLNSHYCQWEPLEQKESHHLKTWKIASVRSCEKQWSFHINQNERKKKYRLPPNHSLSPYTDILFILTWKAKKKKRKFYMSGAHKSITQHWKNYKFRTKVLRKKSWFIVAW